MRLRMEQTTHEVTIEHSGETSIFEVRPLTLKENESIIDKHTPPRKWKGQLMTEKSPCYSEMTIEKVQKTIISWDIKDLSGKKVDCTDANKAQAWLLNPEVINQVMDKAAEIADGVTEAEKADIKN